MATKRVTLTEDDIELLVKLVNDADRKTGFAYTATTQRVKSLLEKLTLGDE